MDPHKKFRPTQRPTQKHLDPCKYILDPRNQSNNYDSRKKYFDPRNPRDTRKNLTHETHAPRDPRNPRYHATHAI